VNPDSINEEGRHRESQDALLEFLRADLDLSFTMLGTAELDRTSDNPTEIDHYHAALRRVRRSITVIRRLQARIEDSSAAAAILDRTDNLERALESFPA
jgi:hypothetical protein